MNTVDTNTPRPQPLYLNTQKAKTSTVSPTALSTIIPDPSVFHTTSSPTRRTIIPSLPLTITLPPITVTPFPIELLSDAEKLRVMDLLTTKENCKLPCWNGIIPGHSDIYEVQGFFARLGYDIGNWPKLGELDTGNYEAKLTNFPPGTLQQNYFYVNVSWQAGIIDGIDIEYWDHPEQYTLERIIKIMGLPDDIRIINGIGGKIPLYAIGLFYQGENTIIQIRGNLYKSDDLRLPYKVCIEDKQKQYLIINLYSGLNKNLILSEFGMAPWEDWAKDLDISMDDLVTMLLKPTQCILYP